jgi:hypothetical protein
MYMYMFIFIYNFIFVHIQICIFKYIFMFIYLGEEENTDADIEAAAEVISRNGLDIKERYLFCSRFCSVLLSFICYLSLLPLCFFLFMPFWLVYMGRIENLFLKTLFMSFIKKHHHH